MLAHWTAFAQSSLALPKTAEGDRWRACVPAIIGLQAVTLAVKDIDRLPEAHGRGPEDVESERAVGLDKASVLVRSYARDLRDAFKDMPLHDELTVLVDDARRALEAARSAGWEWRVTAERLTAEHPSDLVALVLSTGFDGDLYLPSPGVDLFRETPAAFCRDSSGGRPNERTIRAIKEFLLDVGKPERIAPMRQVYRQFDFAKGGPVRDLVAPMDAELPAGQPLLVPAIVGGEEAPVSLPPRRGAAIPVIPVVFAEKLSHDNDAGESRPG